MTHLAQTNHGTLSGHREFQEAATEAGIVPILGVEAYISSTDRFDKRSKTSRNDDTSIYNHIILLAQNETGLKTLNHLSEIAWTEGFYSKPRIDSELLFDNNNGLIVLSGCLNGLIAKSIEKGDLFNALKIAQNFKAVLGDRFYIEVQGHNPPEMNAALLQIADNAGIKPVATSDCHYARKEDLWVEEAMLILSTKPKKAHGTSYEQSKKIKDILERYNYLYPDRTMSFQEIEIFLRDRKSNQELFEAQGVTRQDIYDNTMEVASRIGEVPYYKGLDFLPRPSGDPDKILEKKAMAGLKARGLVKPEYLARLREELDVIKSKGFSTYFLIVEDMVSYARKHDIPVGPGRGSAAGSLVCYALQITDVDPIEHGLLFFRFINPDRNDFPDIDTDFGDVRRAEIKEYLHKKYGHVASIATFTRFQGKNSLKDAARVLGVPIGDVNRATKNNDAPPGSDYFDVFDKSEQGKVFTKAYPEAVDLAKRLYGKIRAGGMHAAGVIVANQPIHNYAPVQTAKDPHNPNGPRVTYVANDFEQAADIGFIKLDILGLKNLTIIDETLRDVKERHGKVIDPMRDIPLNDPKVYKMLNDGYTQAVFQADGGTFTKWLLDTKCTEFNDLVVGTSIARPGALNTVGEVYKRRLAGIEPVSFDHEVMKRHTEETLGLIVYQDQVMLAMTDLAGMKMTTADKVRKIIGKKRDVTEFEQYKEEFVEGASKRVSRELAEKLWHDFEAHAGYSFNKSHAVVYSYITYWTAWLKYHYPLEYMAATLRNEKDKDSYTDHLIEIKRLGIPVYLPHINLSEPETIIQRDGIRLGLNNVKFISDAVSAKIIAARPFKSYGDLMVKAEEKGSGLNARMLKAMDLIGGLAFEDHPLRGDERDYYYEYLGIPAFEGGDLEPRVKNKFRTFDEFDEKGVIPFLAMSRKIKRGEGWARVDFVDETGSAGIFAAQDIPIESGQMYAILVADNRIHKYLTIDELRNGVNSSFYKWLHEEKPSVPEDAYRVISFKSYTTKANKKMAYLILQDEFGLLHHVLAFPREFMQAFAKCREGRIIKAEIKETQEGTKFLESVNEYK